MNRPLPSLLTPFSIGALIARWDIYVPDWLFGSLPQTTHVHQLKSRSEVLFPRAVNVSLLILNEITQSTLFALKGQSRVFTFGEFLYSVFPFLCFSTCHCELMNEHTSDPGQLLNLCIKTESPHEHLIWSEALVPSGCGYRGELVTFQH